MIEIKPNININFSCPECKSDQIGISGLAFPGIRILADCKCEKCGFEFYNDMPTGHALYYPMQLGKKNNKIYDNFNIKWFAEPLLHSYQNPDNRPLKIEKKVYQEKSEVIILNCIDYLYGHVLLKLFNAQFYIEKFPDKGLILIIPKSFEWLVPKGVAEVWSLDIKLKDAKNWFTELNKFVNTEIKKYNKIYLSPAYSHPDLAKVDISLFVKEKPFDLKNFSEKKPVVTFIYREDRLWHSNNLEYFIYKVCRKLKINKYFNWIFLSIQNKRITAFFKNLRNKNPDIECNVAGLGSHGSFPSFIKDKRETKINDKIESDWCKIYSESHIVAGIHGSNMLIPTALSGAFLEILPSDRIGNITQDVFAKYSDRQMLYLGRFLHEYISPKGLGDHATVMICDFPIYQLYTDPKHLKYELMKDMRDHKDIFSRLFLKNRPSSHFRTINQLLMLF